MTHLPGSHHGQQWKIDLVPEPSLSQLSPLHRQPHLAGQKRSPEQAGLPPAQLLVKKAAAQRRSQEEQEHRDESSKKQAPAASSSSSANHNNNGFNLQQAAASRSILRSPPSPAANAAASMRAAAGGRSSQMEQFMLMRNNFGFPNNVPPGGNSNFLAALSSLEHANSPATTSMMMMNGGGGMPNPFHMNMLLAWQRQQQQQQQDMLGMRLETLLMRQRMAAAAAALPQPNAQDFHPQMYMTAGEGAHASHTAGMSTKHNATRRGTSADQLHAVDAMFEAIKSKSPTNPIGDEGTNDRSAGVTMAAVPPSAGLTAEAKSSKTTSKKTIKAAVAPRFASGTSPETVTKEHDDHSLAAVPRIVPTPDNPVGRPLGIDEDCNWLSELHSFMRLHMVELCLAKEEDVAHRRVHKPSVDGFQIGIRCRCCSHLPPGDREPRSTAFPSAMAQLYQSFAMMLRDHFSKCRHMPPPLRKRFLQLKEKTTQGASDAKQYWVYAAQTLGLDDSAEGLVLSSEAQRRAASMPPFGASDDDASISTAALVTTSDKECGAPDLAYTLLLLARPVTLTPQERKGHKKSLPVGLPGFACRYCCELNRRGNCRFFPVRKRTLAGKLDELYEHLERCTACPKTDKDLLRALKARDNSTISGAVMDGNKTPKLSREMKGFLDVVWSRINSHQ